MLSVIIEINLNAIIVFALLVFVAEIVILLNSAFLKQYCPRNFNVSSLLLVTVTRGVQHVWYCVSVIYGY